MLICADPPNVVQHIHKSGRGVSRLWSGFCTVQALLGLGFLSALRNVEVSTFLGF